jgi:hypothetical protein
MRVGRIVEGLRCLARGVWGPAGYVVRPLLNRLKRHLFRVVTLGRGMTVRGHGWWGYYNGQPGGGRDVFAQTVSEVFDAVRRQFSADFGCDPRSAGTLLVFCYADTNGDKQALLDFGEKNLGLTRSLGRGLYLCQLPGVLIFLNPLLDGFRCVLAHELAHALADLVLSRGATDVFWASEGYAHYIAVVCQPDGMDLQHAYLATVSEHCRSGQSFSLRQMLAATAPSDDSQADWLLRCQAALFVSFLASLRASRPAGWAALRTALAGQIRSPEQARESLEHALDATDKMIEQQFFDYCIDEAKRLPRELPSRLARHPQQFYGQIWKPKIN